MSRHGPNHGDVPIQGDGPLVPTRLVRHFLAAYYDHIVPVVRRMYEEMSEMDKHNVRRIAGVDSADEFVRQLAESLAICMETRDLDLFLRDSSKGFPPFTPEMIESATVQAIERWVLDECGSGINDICSHIIGLTVSDVTHNIRSQLEPIIFNNRSTRTLLNAIGSGSIQFRKQAGLRGEMVTDPSQAKDLAERHQRLNRARQIASAILAYDEGHQEPLRDISKMVSHFGGFLMDYTEEFERTRIRSPRWVIARAIGRPLEIDAAADSQALPHILMGEEIIGGDAQVHVPSPKKKARLYFELPDPRKNDIIYGGGGIAELIRKDHSIAGCMSDICADDRVAHQGFASKARETAFMHILEFHKHIRFIIAEIMSVRGLILENGKRIELDMPIVNSASILMHAKSERFWAPYGWELKERNVPVKVAIQGAEHIVQLITDWKCMIHDLRVP